MSGSGDLRSRVQCPGARLGRGFRFQVSGFRFKAGRAAAKTLISEGLVGHAERFTNPFNFKLMKKSHLRTGPWNAAFTLVELLTVIAIIAILAAMILPAISAAKQAARKAQAHTEEAQLVTAITSYEADYSRFPVTTNEQTVANANGINDFTTGLVFGPGVNGNNTGYSYDNNSNVIAILMDWETFPNGSYTCNQHHLKNPRQTKYLNAKTSDYDPTQGGQGSPGVDKTGIYRDPWGNPYVITMDLSYDNKCSDMLYCKQAVSQQSGQQGFNGLSNTNLNGAGDFFLYNGTVMVWSAGPDGTYSGAVNVKTPPNKDNVLSWQ